MRIKKMKNKIKNFFENKAFDENVLRKLIQEEQRKRNELEKRVTELEELYHGAKNISLKNKQDIRKINTTLGTSKTLKEIRRNIV